MTYIGEDATRLFSAIVVKQALILLRAGIVPNRHLTLTHCLMYASSYTKNKYRRAQVDAAIYDLDIAICAMRAAISVD